MIRTVVRAAPPPASTSPPAPDPTGDSYLAKLVKYVPVEGLTAFLPIAAFASTDMQRWAVFVASLVVGLALIVAQARVAGSRPRLWYWPFVAIAFGAWSVGASEEFRELLGVADQSGALVLALCATALPALDSALDSLFPA